MIIVSGCPRSGTSLMSSILREVVGHPNFHGEKFPWVRQIERFKANASESDLYVRNKTEPGWDEPASEDMNPNGFWECPWTVQGCSRYNQRPGPMEGAKIVSQGLANSNPEAITRVIMMVRPPQSVAKSQEQLKRKFGQELGTVHSPEMFCKVSVSAARWIHQHKPIITVVEFNDLLADPAEVLARLDDWTEDCGYPGKFSDQAGKIDQSLKRSAGYETPEQSAKMDAWQDADSVYDLLRSGNWEELAKFERKQQDPNQMLYCTRFGAQVSNAICMTCRDDETTRNNLKKTADERGINWEFEPCIYECRSGMSIADSINNNHWNATD